MAQIFNTAIDVPPVALPNFASFSSIRNYIPNQQLPITPRNQGHSIWSSAVLQCKNPEGSLEAGAPSVVVALVTMYITESPNRCNCAWDLSTGESIESTGFNMSSTVTLMRASRSKPSQTAPPAASSLIVNLTLFKLISKLHTEVLKMGDFS